MSGAESLLGLVISKVAMKRETALAPQLHGNFHFTKICKDENH